MKNTILILIVMLSLSSCKSGGPQVFVQISDPQLGFMTRSADHSPEMSIMGTIINQVNELDPDIVVFSGDLVHWRTDSAAVADFDSLLGRFPAGLPVYCLPGNHDVGNEASAEDVEAFISHYGSDRFVHEGKSYTVIGYNSCVVKANTSAEHKEYQWLQEQLSNCRKNKPIIVVAHHPIFLYSADEPETYENFPVEHREKYLSLLEQYKVDLYLAGHLHKSARGEYNGVQFITCSAAGRQLGKDQHGYNIIRISGKEVQVEYITAQPNKTSE